MREASFEETSSPNLWSRFRDFLCSLPSAAEQFRQHERSLDIFSAKRHYFLGRGSSTQTCNQYSPAIRGANSEGHQGP